MDASTKSEIEEVKMVQIDGVSIDLEKYTEATVKRTGIELKERKPAVNPSRFSRSRREINAEKAAKMPFKNLVNEVMMKALMSKSNPHGLRTPRQTVLAMRALVEQEMRDKLAKQLKVQDAFGDEVFRGEAMLVI